MSSIEDPKSLVWNKVGKEPLFASRRDTSMDSDARIYFLSYSLYVLRRSGRSRNFFLEGIKISNIYLNFKKIIGGFSKFLGKSVPWPLF